MTTNATNVDTPESLLREAVKSVDAIRDEHKMHGHITDASAHWLIKIKPRIDAYLATGGWVPIETAPRDGGWALVSADGAINCMYVERGKLPDDWTHPQNPNVQPSLVTHWQPLPSLPIKSAPRKLTDEQLLCANGENRPSLPKEPK